MRVRHTWRSAIAVDTTSTSEVREQSTSKTWEAQLVSEAMGAGEPAPAQRAVYDARPGDEVPRDPVVAENTKEIG